jgi:microcystin-dependent protein
MMNIQNTVLGRWVLIFIGMALLVFLAAGYARAGSVPNTFVPGTPAKAAEVNANFTYVNQRVVPAGAIMAFGGTTAPAGWLLCDGSEVSRTDYAELFAAISIYHGGGNGTTTFNLPDYRGRFLRGVDGSAGRDPDKGTRSAMNSGGSTTNNVGSVQGDEFKSHAHDGIYTGAAGGASLFIPRTNGGASVDGQAVRPSGGSETRPANAYVNWIIKY